MSASAERSTLDVNDSEVAPRAASRTRRIERHLEQLCARYGVNVRAALEDLRAGGDLDDPELSPARLQAYVKAAAPALKPCFEHAPLRAKLVAYARAYPLCQDGKTLAWLTPHPADKAVSVDGGLNLGAEEVEVIASMPDADVATLLELKRRFGAVIKRPVDEEPAFFPLFTSHARCTSPHH